MTDPRLRWYRQRAEDEAREAEDYLQLSFGSRKIGYRYTAEDYERSAMTHLREAAHYANLVLDGETHDTNDARVDGVPGGAHGDLPR